MLLISGIKLPVGRDKSEAITRALHALAVRPEQVQAAHLAKVSLDARRQNAMQLVCSVKVQLHTPAPVSYTHLRHPSFYLASAVPLVGQSSSACYERLSPLSPTIRAPSPAPAASSAATTASTTSGSAASTLKRCAVCCKTGVRSG